MLKKSILVMSALSMVALPVAAEAQRYGYYNGDGDNQDDDEGYAQQQANYQRQQQENYYRQQENYYRQQGYYPQRTRAYGNRYYGRSDGYRQHRCSGTTGTVVGAGAGALLGHSIGRGSGYYHQHSGTTGAILGGALGALIGRQVGKSTC